MILAAEEDADAAVAVTRMCIFNKRTDIGRVFVVVFGGGESGGGKNSGEAMVRT